MNSKVLRQDNESFEDYFVRLFDWKSEYGLTCNDICDILNKESGNNYDVSTYRKEYAAFNRGRIYEHNKYEQNVETRILSISDLHYPFSKPIDTFHEYVGKVDILQLNGDILDCTMLSKFPKTYRSSPLEEIVGARAYLIKLIEYIRPKKVVANYGNHEVRLGVYLANHVDNEIQELMPETALDYIFTDGFMHYNRFSHSKTFYEPLSKVFDGKVDIEYSGQWWSKIGRTIFVHPKTFCSAPMKTAEKAMLWFRNEGVDFDTIVMGHTHRVGFYKIGAATIYEQGASCETGKMQYNNGMLTNSQKEGFMYLCLDKDGNNVEKASKIITLN